jgi:hypothetical protein
VRREVGRLRLDALDRVPQSLLNSSTRALRCHAVAPSSPTEANRTRELACQELHLRVDSLGASAVGEALYLVELLPKIEKPTPVPLHSFLIEYIAGIAGVADTVDGRSELQHVNLLSRARHETRESLQASTIAHAQRSRAPRDRPELTLSNE